MTKEEAIKWFEVSIETYKRIITERPQFEKF